MIFVIYMYVFMILNESNGFKGFFVFVILY